MPDPRHLALLARTPIPQELPGIEPQFVPVVPMKFDGIFADRFSRRRLGRRFEHGQRSWRRFGRLSWLAASLAALLIAERTRAGVAEIGECVVGMMAVLPLDVYSRARGDIDLDGFGIRPCHSIQYRMRGSAVVETAPTPIKSMFTPEEKPYLE